jgi:ribosomal protein S18 acetylase RimI-like enzyme
MLTVTSTPAATSDEAIHPLIEFSVDVSGDCLASGELLSGSWIGDGSGQIVAVRWDKGEFEAARAVIEAAVEAAQPGTELQLTANTEVHDWIPERVALFESVGFTLWQEKEGFWFTDIGQEMPPPEGVIVRTLADIGRDAFIDVIAACTPGTLDRVDADWIASTGAHGWASTLVEDCFQPGDEQHWYVITDTADEPVGFVAPSAFDEPDTGTIQHIGVVAGHRGHGYVDQLLRLANRTVRDRGWIGMRSDVDVTNAPMLAAMRRNGHREDARPWHKWYFHRTK